MTGMSGWKTRRSGRNIGATETEIRIAGKWYPTEVAAAIYGLNEAALNDLVELRVDELLGGTCVLDDEGMKPLIAAGLAKEKNGFHVLTRLGK